MTPSEYDIWYNNIMEKNSHMTWVKNICWKLDVYSCILVPRNRNWFKTVVPKFKEIWDTILRERKTGWSHRLPKKKQKKEVNNIKQKVNIIKIDTSGV